MPFKQNIFPIIYVAIFVLQINIYFFLLIMGIVYPVPSSIRTLEVTKDFQNHKKARNVGKVLLIQVKRKGL